MKLDAKEKRRWWLAYHAAYSPTWGDWYWALWQRPTLKAVRHVQLTEAKAERYSEVRAPRRPR